MFLIKHSVSKYPDNNLYPDISKTLINPASLHLLMKNKKCPKCSSSNVKIIDYLGAKCIKCGNCSYDESKLYDVYPEEKTSQKEKGRYTPYKAGGYKRAGK
jgi:predicted nucleic-acid-binding Zn-ribbon protein